MLDQASGEPPTIDRQKLDRLLGLAVGDLSAGYGGVMISIGHKLGLYRAMQGVGPISSQALAERSGCAERYVREWLNSQVAGGYLEYHPGNRAYELAPEQAMVLADETSPVFLPNAWQIPASMWFDEAKAIDAIRTGDGIPWGDHDGRLYCGVAAFYRNAYAGSLVSEWLPSIDGLVERLTGGMRVADIGCGHGHSTILMAQAFPEARFFGFDSHRASIEAARLNARDAGVEDRVQFDVNSATDYEESGFGLICFFDCLHDMGDPTAAARHAAQALSNDGSVMLVEPFANDRTEDNCSPVARLYYAASTTMCCAHAISEGGHLVLGAQAGQAQLETVFREAGFSQFRRTAETPFNLILEAKL